ncbi:MAG: MotA/TolQ/ExbB proton channel family protein [Puniceicoccaceae bacterium]|nr:MotA/TolQ/ExbB proton channel family protein [Puniceicoccaceae bacterium]
MLSIHRLVPIREQDPETLAEVGIVLVDRGYESADDYFEQILNQYPKRFERAAAYYGKAKLAAKNERLDEARRWLIRFLEETPTHSLAAEARLLAADILTRQGVYTAARKALDEILQIKEMRGRPHARALAGLARIETEQDHAKRAIPYWQRIYTLYRAYTELVVEAYWESAQLFEEIDDPIAARNTLAELSVSHEKAENLFIENLEAEENSVSQWVTYLNVVASVAPMIGLLGTVSGMISAFQTIGRGGMGRPELLAGDIGEALITTATGLVIGIPAMIAYFVLKNRLNTAMIATAQAGSEVLDAKEEKAYTSSS